MGYNSNCYEQSCSNNCCNYYGYCTSTYSSYYYSSYYTTCYYTYNSSSSAYSYIDLSWIYYVVFFGVAGIALIIGLSCYCYRRRQRMELQRLSQQAALNNGNIPSSVVINDPGVNLGGGMNISYGQSYQQPIGQPYQPPIGQPYGVPNYGQPYTNPQQPLYDASLGINQQVNYGYGNKRF